MYLENKPTILMGDINIDLLSEKVDRLRTSWIRLATALDLNQKIKTPTRETDKIQRHSLIKYMSTMMSQCY